MKQYLPLLPVLQMLSMSPCVMARGLDESPAGSRRGGCGEVHFTVDRDGSRLNWTIHEAELNHGVVRHHSDYALPLPARALSISALLNQIPLLNDGAWKFHTLSRASLLGGATGNFTMAERLAVAASRSNARNRATGRPRGLDVNLQVKSQCGTAAMHNEPRPLFGAERPRLETASMEMVFVLGNWQLPFFPRLGATGERPSNKVPFDCRIWFSARRASEVRQ